MGVPPTNFVMSLATRRQVLVRVFVRTLQGTEAGRKRQLSLSAGQHSAISGGLEMPSVIGAAGSVIAISTSSTLLSGCLESYFTITLVPFGICFSENSFTSDLFENEGVIHSPE